MSRRKVKKVKSLEGTARELVKIRQAAGVTKPQTLVQKEGGKVKKKIRLASEVRGPFGFGMPKGNKKKSSTKKKKRS